MARGLNRLQSLVAGFTKDIDDRADAVATELTTKRDRCISAVERVKTDVGKVFDDAAKGAEDMLNQLTNGGPPLDGSQG